MTKSPLPRLMKANSIGIQIEGTGTMVQLHDIEKWPNRGEFKRVGSARKFYLYNGGDLLVETYATQGDLPDIFGLRFKRVVHTHVDFKSKVQSITALFKTYDYYTVETMHEMTDYDS